MNILQRWHLGECNINYYDRGTSFALLVYLWSRDNSVATTSSTHRHVANMSSPIRQEDASGRHDVPSDRQCIVRKLSAIASGRDRVVSRSSYVRLCVATGASIGRQYVVKQIIWRCTGDFWWISSREDGASTSPDVASWCERGFSGGMSTRKLELSVVGTSDSSAWVKNLIALKLRADDNFVSTHASDACVA